MEERLYPNLNENNWEEIINKKLKEVNSFNNSINNINLISKFYEEEYKKLKKKHNKYKNLNKILNTIDSVAIISTTSTSITLSLTGYGLIIVPITAGCGCVMTVGSKIISEFLKKKEKSYLKKYTLSHNTLNDFRKLYQKSLEDNIINENEYKKFTDMYNNYQNEKTKQKNTFLY